MYILDSIQRLKEIIVATVSSEDPILQDTDRGDKECCLTIAERLALTNTERHFLDGPEDLSERETRKRIAHSAARSRHEAR